MNQIEPADIFPLATNRILAYPAYLPLSTLFHIVHWEQYPELVIHSVFDKYFYQNLEMTSRWVSFHEWGLHHLPLSLQALSGPFLSYRSQMLNCQSYCLSGCSDEWRRQLGQGVLPGPSARYRQPFPRLDSSEILQMPVKVKKPIIGYLALKVCGKKNQKPVFILGL